MVQYQIDTTTRGAEQVYKSFNLVMRRKPKENNFKPILDTIRSLMNSRSSLPSWLNDVFLGYGDPTAAGNVHHTPTINYLDTFLDQQHLTDSFPGLVRITLRLNTRWLTGSLGDCLNGSATVHRRCSFEMARVPSDRSRSRSPTTSRTSHTPNRSNFRTKDRIRTTSPS